MDDEQIEALKKLKDSFEEIGVKLAWERLTPATPDNLESSGKLIRVIAFVR